MPQFESSLEQDLKRSDRIMLQLPKLEKHNQRCLFKIQVDLVLGYRLQPWQKKWLWETSKEVESPSFKGVETAVDEKITCTYGCSPIEIKRKGKLSLYGCLVEHFIKEHKMVPPTAEQYAKELISEVKGK